MCIHLLLLLSEGIQGCILLPEDFCYQAVLLLRILRMILQLTGIHRKSLSGYENNVAEPDLSTFATLANLYGISADEALEIGEPDPSVSLLRFEFQVLSLFKELDAKHQEELLIQITALVRYLNAKNMVPQNHQSR